MFLVFKKKFFTALLFIVLILGFVGVGLLQKSKTVFIPKSDYTVVIDAGHGGIDGGCVGKNTGVVESDLNLAYSLNLAGQLKEMGIRCVLTRKDKDGLYDKGAKNLKRSEMKKRQEIIENTNPNVVVSIHMNSFPIHSTKGAKSFYKKGNELGKTLAQSIQRQLKSNMDYVNGEAKEGDYYVLNCTDIPSVLVECGFLSNETDEVNLQDKDYQTKICYSILSGIIDFLNIG